MTLDWYCIKVFIDHDGGGSYTEYERLAVSEGDAMGMIYAEYPDGDVVPVKAWKSIYQ